MLKGLGYMQRYAISRLLTNKPILLTHSLTSKCNCKCKVCDVWRKNYDAHEMSAREVFRMLDEARRFGFVAYLAFGGEPLARPDALDILRYAHRLGLYTSIITNGTYLPAKAKEIAEVVDLTWVSLDYNSDYHDEMRGLRGAFSMAMEGIIKLNNEGGKIAINCVLSKLNMDTVKSMAELARRLRIKVAFDPMTVFPGINEEYALSSTERKSLFSQVLQLKQSGYPILNSTEFLEHLVKPIEYSCAQPKIIINVHENGEVRPFWCQKSDGVIGDLRKQSLGEILSSASFKAFVGTVNGCNLCNNSTTVEISMFYSAKVFIKNRFRPSIRMRQFR